MEISNKIMSSTNEVKSRPVHRYSGIYRTTREKHRKTLARRSSDEGCVSNGVSYLQITPVGRHSTSGREQEERRKILGPAVRGVMGCSKESLR